MRRVSLVAVVSALSVLGPAWACSDFMLPFEAGKAPVISGRTMDFTDMFNTMVVKVPKGEQFISGAPGKTGKDKGLRWKTQYGYVTLTSINKQMNPQALGVPIQELPVADGMNSEGLSVAALWLSYATFPQPSAPACTNCMDANLLSSYLLGTAATVEQAVEKLGRIQVWARPELLDVDRFHLAIHDRNGKSVVVEYVNGTQRIYANDLGVLTNEPPYDWQAINYHYLYRHLQPEDVEADDYVDFTSGKNGVLRATAHGWQAEVLGSGMYGLPGDSTSPSRFVRMAALRQTFPTQYDVRDGVQYALQLLGRVAVTEAEVKLEQNKGTNPTLWWVVRDHTNGTLYYAMRLNHELKAVDLNKLDFGEGSGIKSFTISSDGPWSTDQTAELR